MEGSATAHTLSFHFVSTMSTILLGRGCKGPTTWLWSGANVGNITRWQKPRPFSSSPAVLLSVAEMSRKDLAGLRVDQNRLMNDIHSTCEWGKGERWGE